MNWDKPIYSTNRYQIDQLDSATNNIGVNTATASSIGKNVSFDKLFFFSIKPRFSIKSSLSFTSGCTKSKWLHTLARKHVVPFFLTNTHWLFHYPDVIMSAMASQITDVSIVSSTFSSGADQRKHQSSASLAFVRGIQRWPVTSLHKGTVTRKIFPFEISTGLRIIHWPRLSMSEENPTLARRPHAYPPIFSAINMSYSRTWLISWSDR